MSTDRQPGLILKPDRLPGHFARRQTEKARRAWYELPGDLTEQWNEYRRREAGARAEEAVGRFVDLLDGWEGARVFHGVEFRGADLPHGDVDHLVIFDKLEFAFMIESKYRLTEDAEQRHLPRAIKYAQAIGGQLGVYTWPVLCQALEALRDGTEEDWIGRRWSGEGTVLVCDAMWIPRSITDIVEDLDAFRAGNWHFADHHPAEVVQEPQAPAAPETPTRPQAQTVYFWPRRWGKSRRY